MAARFRFLEAPGPLAMAHRGGAAEAAENTWAAFSHAIEGLGYSYVETDVHASADGVVAVIHDRTLDRTTDRTGAVEDLSWAEVSSAHIAGSQRVPRLDEVLAAWPQVRWNIDAKHDSAVGPLVATIRRAGATERVCVASSAQRRLRDFRRMLGPELCTSMAPGAVASLRAASYLPSLISPRTWRAAGAAQVAPSRGPLRVLDERFVAAAHRAGLAVHAWTINDEEAMLELLDLGVDGIMTDRPTLLRNVLRRRGQWS